MIDSRSPLWLRCAMLVGDLLLCAILVAIDDGGVAHRVWLTCAGAMVGLDVVYVSMGRRQVRGGP